MTQYQLTLNSPMTKEDWNKITDANMEYTKSVTFQTEGGKEVEFVKVVRCKDCKHYYQNFCGFCGLLRKEHAADWFCADGKRRDDNGISD